MNSTPPGRRVGIRNISDYSPFGVLLKERTFEEALFRTGFQGQEHDDEVKGEGNSYTTEFRLLDPRIGRWLSLDPLAAKYASMSPYCTIGNNPILLVDQGGDSLRLYGTEVQQKQTLAQLQKLTNDELTLYEGKVLIRCHGTVNTDKELNIGSRLIEEMIVNQNTVHIFQNTQEDNASYGLEGQPVELESNGVGVGGRIQVDFTHTTTLTVINKETGRAEDGYTPTHIVLGHELIHAYYKMKGESHPDEEMVSYRYINEEGISTPMIQEREEAETVGLAGNRKFTENKLREEHGYRSRAKY
jgi:RHS repeat-associated protein